MKLFTIDENDSIELNKPWILLIPEFAALLRRDKRGTTKGDTRGDKKLRARKELTFIYFDLDFGSPLRDWEPDKRRGEALRYAGLTEADIDELVMEAHDHYKVLLLNSSRSLKTLRSLQKGLDALDAHFETVNFTDVDKMGKIKYTPEMFQNNVIKLSSMRDAVLKYEKSVEEELRADSGIRGKAELGGKEQRTKPKGVWSEGRAPASDRFSTQGKLEAVEREDDDV